MFSIKILDLNDPYFHGDPKSGFVIEFANFRRYYIKIKINMKSNYDVGLLEADSGS